MADKRRFYNCDAEGTKGFTTKVFFEQVLAMAQGEPITDEMATLIARAAEYELEGKAAASAKKGATGERKDEMASPYAVAIKEAIIPLLSAEAKSAKELIDAATAKGKVNPANGKPFAAPWVAKVLNKEEENGVVEKVKKIVETTDAKGLKAQKEVTAYKRA